ncbi:MAG: homoserine kinase [Candidatus Rifleibacteriota bacterium]
MVKFYAPASIGNVGVGFDLLGAAIEPIDGTLLGDVVSVELNKSGIEFEVTGPWKEKLPPDQTLNIVYKCVNYYLKKFGAREEFGLKVTLEKNLPVGSGLGSSASSIVAAISALNEFFEKPLNERQMLELMAEFEGQVSGSIHYDNVAPSFLGGIQLMLETPEKICDRIPVFKEWYWIVAFPGITLSTAKMRALLPETYFRRVLLNYGRNLGGFIHASHIQDPVLAASLLKDVVAEPFRSSSIPNYEKTRKDLQALGCLATGISGSGPTIFTITDSLATADLAMVLLARDFFINENGFAKICKISETGAKKLD